MDVGIHQLISSRLDQLQAKGQISEYLVAWKGEAGRHEPNVTVWLAENSCGSALAADLRWLIGDLVKSANLKVI